MNTTPKHGLTNRLIAMEIFLSLKKVMSAAFMETRRGNYRKVNYGIL